VHSSAHALRTPPFYFPLRHGRYDVAPGLTKLAKDHGAGTADAQLFQLDDTFVRFRAAKAKSRGRSFERCVLAHNLDLDVEAAVGAFIAERLSTEHRQHFSLDQTELGTLLHCNLTGETLRFNPRMRLAEHGQYASALDALAMQVQEDIAVVSTDPHGEHWLSFAHICLPNGWAPEEKIGRSFAAVHEPVAGMADMNRRGDEFVKVMVGATDGLVRFAWGVTFDDDLNHHPRSPRPPFDPQHPRAFLRVERQTIRGLPSVGASLFTIRTYLYDLDTLRHDPATRDPLVAALRTMPAESLAYKGIAPHQAALVRWLESAA
jgi:dimethylamine monooxygenase subunit A